MLPLFAPGPGLGGHRVLDDIRDLYAKDPTRAWRRFEAERTNTLRWRDILEAFPWLAPAVEPGVRVMAYGQPVVLDASRPDSLRCGGNGVVGLAAAVAFTVLLGRAGITADTENIL